MLLIAARDRAEDAAVRSVLSQMIDDEREHVLLAWEALAWLCERFGEDVRAAIARVFVEAERHVGFGATTSLLGDVASMRAHGYLPIAERRPIAAAALRELVLPAARAIGGGYATIASAAIV
jgi:rubrerythrin